eukprot:scaffold84461_cov44-Prasinocladus_malaysianus.AAC.1
MLNVAFHTLDKGTGYCQGSPACSGCDWSVLGREHDSKEAVKLNSRSHAPTKGVTEGDSAYIVLPRSRKLASFIR